MQPSDVPALATVVHLFLIEPLPIYTFYLSWLCMSLDLAGFLDLWYQNLDAVPKNMTVVGEFVNCVNDDVLGAIFSMDPRFKGECISFAEDGDNFLGTLNWGCLLLCVIVAAVNAGAVLVHGELDFCKGSYLVYKWRLEQSRFFHYTASLLLLYVVFALYMIGGYVYDSMGRNLGGKLAVSFLNYQAIGVVGLICSARALTQGQVPRFRYQSETFAEIRFRRSWSSMFWLTNAALAQELETAILMAAVGKQEFLENLLQDPSQAQQLLAVCGFGESDKDGSCSDSWEE